MLLGYFIRMLRTWRRYRACVRELSRLDDRELADIGLARSQITWVAFRTARDLRWHEGATSISRGGVEAKN
jgi:uncharacterized protein YjiS (DUF1127 family)